MEDNNVINLNVGGKQYSTTRRTLLKDSQSLLHEWFGSSNGQSLLPTDNSGALFIDRDGTLFRYVLDYLRTDRLILPENFEERKRLINEAQYYKLTRLIDLLLCGGNENRNTGDITTNLCSSGYIIVGYQGTFSFGPQGLPAGDVNFRKITRVLISGRVSLCREVFGETLNEGRDPDRGHSNDRYTARFYLKHNILEQAFDMLGEASFKLVGSCASGTTGNAEPKPGSNTEEDRWAHYSEFIFYRA